MSDQRVSAVGVDTGGTFTDSVIISADGDVYFDQAPTTPDDFSRGAIDSLETIVGQLDASLETVLDEADRVGHGTTVATNAMIEKEGCQVGLLGTRGFEDTSVIMRDGLGKSMGVPSQVAMDYLHNERPDALPTKEYIRGINERVDSDGDVVVPLDEEQAREAVQSLVEMDVDAIAISFLWSFQNPEHERRVAEIVAEEAPDVYVTTSSQLSPVIGEYERAMTTILNAYLGPVTSTYIERFNGELGNLGLGARELQIMKCTGGLVPASEAQRSAVSLINSGPVGGLVASQTLGKTLDHENIISTDVGGTSFDVGIIRNGDFAVEKNPFVDKGTPVQIPAADIKTVGAGGGSIVWTKGDRLRVGPKSTGADPGPACYGRGGTDPTLTDILLLLGYMNPEGFWSGRMSLDTDAAEEAIETLTDQLGLSQTEVVTGAYKIAVAKMADLVRKVTVEQGYDPREFVLYSYGGAGPAHAAVYAKELDVKEVIVPQTAPTFSAFGIALADTRRNYAVTDTSSLNDLTADDITDTFAQLEERAHRDIRETNDSPDEYLHSYSVDLRYAGQMNELTVGTERSPTVEDLKASYNETYAMRFGEDAVLDQAEVQAVTYRLDTMKTEVDPDLKAQTDADERAIDPVSTRTMYFPEIGATETPEPVEGKVFDQNELRPGNTFQGPGVVEADKTTIVVPPATDARVDEYNNLRMTWSDSQ